MQKTSDSSRKFSYAVKAQKIEHISFIIRPHTVCHEQDLHHLHVRRLITGALLTLTV